MIAQILDEAEDDLENAFKYYESHRSGLGGDLVEEFRQGLRRILEFPRAWQRLDRTYRRYRLHRFPYGIVYRIDAKDSRIMIVAFMHLSRKPGFWRSRTRRKK